MTMWSSKNGRTRSQRARELEIDQELFSLFSLLSTVAATTMKKTSTKVKTMKKPKTMQKRFQNASKTSKDRNTKSLPAGSTFVIGAGEDGWWAHIFRLKCRAWAADSGNMGFLAKHP